MSFNSTLESYLIRFMFFFSLLQHFIDTALIICHDRLPGFLQLLVWFHVIHVNLKSILIGFGIEIGVIFFLF